MHSMDSPGSMRKRECLKTICGFLEVLTDAGLFLISFLVLSAGSYALYDSILVYHKATDNSLLKYKPRAERLQEPERLKLEKMAAWLTLEDTTIDLPIMQGKDNSEYLNKDPYGRYSLAGSVFLDSRNHPDFSDPYNLVYGHHMEHGAMFGALDRFLDEAYFNSHTKGSLYLGDQCFPIDLLALVEAAGDEEAVFSPTEKDDLTIPYIETHAKYQRGKLLMEKGERLIGLSTCKYPDTSERIILFGKIGKEPKKEERDGEGKPFLDGEEREE